MTFEGHLRYLALALALAGGLTLPAALHHDVAWAQDDDGDDGGGDDNDDDDDDGPGPGARGGGEGRPLAPARRAAPSAPVRAAPASPSPPPPAFAPNEIVSLALGDDDLSTLLARGYRVIEERAVPEIGIVSRRLEIPDGTTLEAARDEVRALPTGTDADFNHYYRTEQAAEPAACQGPHCASFELIGWSAPGGRDAACAAEIAIGVIDTGINPEHATFSAARIELHRIAPEGLDPSRAIHGTAVLALLVGDTESRSPGLLPGTRVVAVDAFHRAAGDERADVFTIAGAMDFLATQGVRVVNMSLAGPPNTVLERATSALVSRDIAIVAAVGNGGPRAEPAYPAGYPDVIAVTAVDRAGNAYRRAGRGPHVDLAAPGVEIWTAASVSGARAKTGTSFAAPFVTAAAASLLAAEPALSPPMLAERLAGTARDLGEEGFDEVFGHGLVQAAQGCADGNPVEAADGPITPEPAPRDGG